SVRVTRGAGSGQHLASVLREGRENANIDAGLGFIWRPRDCPERVMPERIIAQKRPAASITRKSIFFFSRKKCFEFKFAEAAFDSGRRNDRKEKSRLSDSRLDPVFPHLAMRDCSFVLP